MERAVLLEALFAFLRDQGKGMLSGFVSCRMDHCFPVILLFSGKMVFHVARLRKGIKQVGRWACSRRACFVLGTATFPRALE